MSEIERLAAIVRPIMWTWGTPDERDIASSHKAVLALLQAIREPTSDMQLAGGIVHVTPVEGVWFQEIGQFAASDVWRAMVDALLLEEPA